MLLPALLKAEEMGRRSVCISNLRQLFLAAELYAMDNDDYYPPGTWDIENGGGLHRWHGTRVTTSDLFVFEPRPSSPGSPLYPYLITGKIKACPTFKRYYDEPGGPWSTAFEAGCGGYGYNDDYVGSSRDIDGGHIPARRHQIKMPSQTIMFSDCAHWSSGTIVAYSFVTPPQFVFWGCHSTPTIHFRHNGKANVCWCDGHVTSEPMGFTRTPAQRAVNIGYVGKWDDNRLYDREKN
jgi:prepilin-type processing-associated H-X9-DG protein